MARIPRDFIDRLVDDSDIVSVLGQYLNLTKKSSNYVTNCPFHEEKTAHLQSVLKNQYIIVLAARKEVMCLLFYRIMTASHFLRRLKN